MCSLLPPTWGFSIRDSKERIVTAFHIMCDYLVYFVIYIVQVRINLTRREDTFDAWLTLSMTISRTLLSWLTAISDSMSLVVALFTAETLGEASIIFDFKLDLWLGLRTFT